MSAVDKTREQRVSQTEGKMDTLLYNINERPPWYLWLLLSLQQFMLDLTGSILVPLVVAGPICITGDLVGTGEFMATVFFVGGISSFLQTTFGSRLPIMQGLSGSFIAPVVMLMKTNSIKCPVFNITENGTLPHEPGSDEHKEVWKNRMVELQGALLVASAFQIVIGFSGLMGVLMRFIGPLTSSTVVTLIGLSLTTSASINGSTQWWICIVTIALIVLFSQYLGHVTVPFLRGTRLKIFLLLPVLMGIGISWLICFILTKTDLLPDKKGDWGYEARTDIKIEAITNAKWFRLPYPGQWGTPTISAGGVFAMIAAIFASIIESVGDYHACARLCRLPPPPGSSVSRAIGVEGICCMLGGVWGTACGFTSYSQNIAGIGLTKVASRVVVQMAAIFLIVAGCVGKVGAFFSTIPDPIFGGLLYVTFGMITAVGFSNLTQANLHSTRNLFVFGFSVFFAQSLSDWIDKNPITVGNDTANQVLTILCGTSMVIGGAVAFFLDNTLPGSLVERGIIVVTENEEEDLAAYDLPLIQSCVNKVKCFRYIPFCPRFVGDKIKKPKKSKTTDDSSIDIALA